MPFRPPVSTTIRGLHRDAVRHSHGLAGVRPDDAERARTARAGARSPTPAACSVVTAAGKDRGRGPRPDRHQHGRPRPRRLLRGDQRGRPRHGRVVSAQPPRPGPRQDHRGRDAGARSCSSRSAAPPATSPTGTCSPPTPAAQDYTQRYDGDRRFFELQVGLQRQDRAAGGQAGHTWPTGRATRWLPRRQAYTVRGIYSDFKYHDVGEAFYQMQFDGSVIRKWRTPPLWGVGTTAPYGHDGASLTSTRSSAGTAARRWRRARRMPP